jgi:V8-like Glu-specific endopeptidase
MKDCRYPLEYIAYFKDHEKRQAYDYALIRFETPIIHKNYAKLLIDHTFDKSKVHMVEVAGFPGNRIIFKTNGDKEVYPYHHSDKLILQNDSIIQYEADTSEGQSGSPILYLYNNVPYVIGIHNRGIKEKIRANQGVFLQKKVGDNILAWMKEMYLPRPEMFIVGESGISNYSTLDLPSE